MPWESIQQERWGNSKAGHRALGDSGVKEWNAASKGLQLPTRAKPMMAKKYVQSAGEKRYGKTPEEKLNVTKPKTTGPPRVKMARAFKSAKG